MNQLGSFPVREMLDDKARLDIKADLNVTARSSQKAIEEDEGPTTLCELCGEADELLEAVTDNGTKKVCSLCYDSIVSDLQE